MKKTLTSILLIASCHMSMAQTITGTFNPKPENSYFTYIYSGIHAPGNAGINQVYDFSDLASVASSGKLVYSSSASNPDPDAYPTTNVWSADYDDFYTYFKTANNSYNVLGRDINFEGANGSLIYSDLETIKLPINYDDVQIDKIVGTASFVSSGLPVKLFRLGSDSIKLDGYGTLKFGDKSKAVNRLKIVYNYTDSIKYINETRRKNVIRKVEYLYVGLNEDFPTIILTEERKNTVINNNSSVTTTNSLRLHSPTLLTSMENSLTAQSYFSVWQNAAGALVTSARVGDEISVYNLTGQKIYETTATIDGMEINNAELAASAQNILIVKCTNYQSSSFKKVLLK